MPGGYTVHLWIGHIVVPACITYIVKQSFNTKKETFHQESKISARESINKLSNKVYKHINKVNMCMLIRLAT